MTITITIIMMTITITIKNFGLDKFIIFKFSNNLNII